MSGIEIWIDTSLNLSLTTSIRCGMIPSFDVGQSLYLSCNGVQGRYVTVRLPGDNRVLSLCEVQVFPADFVYPQPNVATKGEAVQSSTLFPAGAYRAIDGKRDTYYSEGSCSHTVGNETDPWWRVDLHQIFIISEVKITNRGDCCHERLDGAEIRIGNSLDNNGNDNPRCTNITHIPRGNTFTFTCDSGSMEGRYVNVVIPGDEKILTLCEVEVYGDPAVEPLKQVALWKNTYQSSTWNQGQHHYWISGGAHKPVGLCLDHTFNKDCCSRTYWNQNPWWRVDLGSEYRVSVVVIYNRGDCCSGNIIGAKIKIGKADSHSHNPTCAKISSSELVQTFYCSEMVGRYVSINIRSEYQVLTFCRLEVYGSPVQQPVTLPTPPPPTAVTFPSVSVEIGGMTVLLMNEKLGWSDALLYCRLHHWDLLSVHSPDEQTLVEELLTNSTFVLSDNVWLGLRRELMGLRWFWMSGDAVTFDKWRMYPPLFPTSCGGMESEGGLWRPVPCGELNNFLCQSAPAPMPQRVYYYSSKVKTP